MKERHEIPRESRPEPQVRGSQARSSREPRQGQKKGPGQKSWSQAAAFLEELELGTQPPLQLWGDHTIYLERCDSVLAFGEGYIRFVTGKIPVTVFGTDIRVEEYRVGRLMVRGRFTSIEFG